MADVVLPPHPTPATAERSLFSSSSKNQWDVEFSRFFNYPRRSSAGGVSYLHPIPKRKIRNSGTWIFAESPAVISIVRSAAAWAPVLFVSVAGLIVEEHFVSNLHFPWPQVSCISQCTIRGSRAVFLSYRDRSCQIRKFAVRFPTCCDAENFMGSVKECLHNEAYVAPAECDFVCENSSPSEFTASNGLHYRFDEESSHEEPVATCAPEVPERMATCAAEVPALTYQDEQHDCGLPPLLANNIDTIFSGFPPSFSELLANCLAEVEKEKPAEGGNATSTSLYEGHTQNPPGGGAVLPVFMDDNTDLKSQIVKYMTDASFHDMLSKIENYMDEWAAVYLCRVMLRFVEKQNQRWKIR